MPADAKPRWITVRKPFDYSWPGRRAITSYREEHLGEHLVKAEVADFAVDNGYADEGKLDGSAKSRKATGRRRKSRKAPTKKEAPAAKAANSGAKSPVGDADLPDADRAAGGPAVAPDAG